MIKKLNSYKNSYFHRIQEKKGAILHVSKNTIIIDLDDTLFTTFKRKWLAFKHMEKQFSIPLNLNAKKVANSFGFEDYIKKYSPKSFENIPEKTKENMKNEWFNHFISEATFKIHLENNNNKKFKSFSKEIVDYLLQEQERTKNLSKFISNLVGFNIIYLSGRPQSLYEASVEELKLNNFPLPNGSTIRLQLKNKDQSDLESKHEIIACLDLNSIFCIFEDNEEIIQDILNIYKQQNKRPPWIYRNIPPYRNYLTLGDNVYSDLAEFTKVVEKEIENFSVRKKRSKIK